MHLRIQTASIFLASQLSKNIVSQLITGPNISLLEIQKEVSYHILQELGNFHLATKLSTYLNIYSIIRNNFKLLNHT